MRPCGHDGSTSTRAQWYAVSTSHGFGAAAVSPAAARPSNASAALTRLGVDGPPAPACRRSQTPSASPVTPSAAASPSTMTELDSAATSTKPVPSVAVMPPSVPMLDSLPTTWPVRRRSAS